MHRMEPWKSHNYPAGFKYYYLHASISCVNVCNKVIYESPEAIAVPQYLGTSVKKKQPGCASAGVPHVNFYKPLRALSYFSWANHKRWRGQRAALDVLQLPMGNVSPSHRRGITNGLLSVLTSDGGCSRLTFPAVHRELCITWEGTASRLPGKFIWSSAWRHFDKSTLHISSHFSGNAE